MYLSLVSGAEILKQSGLNLFGVNDKVLLLKFRVSEVGVLLIIV